MLGLPKPLLCLMGPTASGKSALAHEIASHFNIPIINADSASIYRRMDIGTAKPSPEDILRYDYRLIDHREPWEIYSAGDFLEDVRVLLESLDAPCGLLVGGTTLYFKAVQYGLAELPKAHPEYRETLEKEAAELGWPALHSRLLEIDPIAGARIHPHDKQRIQRALEIHAITQRPPSTCQAERIGLPYTIKNLALQPPRELLHQRIEARLKMMFEQGFIEEVASLKAHPHIHAQLPSMKSVGYRQIWGSLEGEYDQQTAFDKALAATRQLAKRQCTGLKGFDIALRLEEPEVGKVLAWVEEWM